MFSRTKRDQPGGSAGVNAIEALEYLTPDLCATLASLHEAPPAVAEATVQLLPFGSRAALETLTPPLAVEGEPIGEGGHRSLKLTPFAYDVMAAAAAATHADPQAIDEWTQRAEAAHAAAQRAADFPRR